MTPINATIEVNDQGLKEMLARAQGKLRDLTPVMREISEIMIEASMRAFAEKKDPETGVPWPELAAATKRYRRKHGRADQNILQFSGLMRASIGAGRKSDSPEGRHPQDRPLRGSCRHKCSIRRSSPVWRRNHP